MSEAHDRKHPAPSRSGKRSSSSTEADGEGNVAADESGEPRICMACHGTGKVISNLDARTRKVTCPWCRGGGERLVGADAQEFQQEQAAGSKRR